jgi:hypothetical protein
VVDSASNGNEYQKHKGGRCVRLTTYYHPVPLSRNLGTLTSWNPLGHSRSVTGLLYLYLYLYHKLLVFLSSPFSYFASNCNSFKCYNILYTCIYLHHSFYPIYFNPEDYFRTDYLIATKVFPDEDSPN